MTQFMNMKTKLETELQQKLQAKKEAKAGEFLHTFIFPRD
jgi:hypothetical protein